MDDRLFDEFLASTLVGSVSFGIGAVLLLLELRSRGSRALAINWMATAVFVVVVPVVAGQVDPDHVTVGERLCALPILVGFLCTPAYLRFLADTAHAEPGARATVRRISYLIAALGIILTGLAFASPARGFNGFIQALDGTDALATFDFWLFAIPTTVVVTAATFAWILISRLELDPGERTRAVVYTAVSPILLTCFLFPTRLMLTMYSAAIVLSLYGLLMHLTVQGERAAFLSRFLSPQVAELVRLNGLGSVTKPQELVLSVVCIDFRGFTAYTEAIPSQAVIDLLSDYHEAIAGAIAQHGGMIKDYAGDGILILVGAPIPRSDHQQAAVALARDARDAAGRVTQRWATGPHPLGVGIGVASGRVTVGAIGEIAQLEYAAVGTAVNLAARLCAQAEDGTILLDDQVAGALPPGLARPRGELSLKGLSHPVSVFEVAASDAEASAVAGEPLA